MAINPKWLDDSIQFPRLIAEITANVEISEADWTRLCDSMDLTTDEVNELFDRAGDVWDRIKDQAAEETS